MSNVKKENYSDSLGKLAWLLDASIKVPFTRWRIGLDGLVGLIPGVGDAVAGVASMWIVLAGVRRGAPFTVVLRMLLNVAVETIIGSIPIIGDLFDFVFRANLRNMDLIRQYEKDPSRTHKKSRWGLILTLALLFLVLVLVIWLAFSLLGWVWGLIAA